MKDVKITNYAECLCGGIKVKIRGKLDTLLTVIVFNVLKLMVILLLTHPPT